MNALAVAAFYGKVEIVRALIEAKSSVNIETKNGDSPLSIAAWKGHEAAALLILQSGGDPNHLDKVCILAHIAAKSSCQYVVMGRHLKTIGHSFVRVNETEQ
jgi:ankyrin repeat protein